MAIIREDYVSFETAWLLKEKGFDWECFGYYVDYKPDDIKYSFLGETNSTWEARCCSAPTLQMTLKWLREVYNLSIRPRYEEVEDEKELLHYLWFFDILSMTPYKILVEPKQGYDTYEQACEEAIKYCLRNLI